MTIDNLGLPAPERCEKHGVEHFFGCLSCLVERLARIFER